MENCDVLIVVVTHILCLLLILNQVMKTLAPSLGITEKRL